MSEHAPEAIQAIHDAWVAQKAAEGLPDPGFPGDDGGLYYSDDDEFWAHFDAPRGRFEPEKAESVQEAYVERLHPRDRLGKWARKLGPVQHTLNALVSAEGTTELLQGTPKRKRGRGGRKAPLKRRATADWKKRVGALAIPPVPAKLMLEKRRAAMGVSQREYWDSQEFLDWWFGTPGTEHRGAVQTVSGDPGTLFTAQHARIMEAGAILDAEITRRMNADPRLGRRRVLERMLRDVKADRKAAEEREHKETWEFLARRMNEQETVISRDYRRVPVEHKTPEEWAAIHAEYMRHTEGRFGRRLKWKIPDAEIYGPHLSDLHEFRYNDAEREGVVDLQVFYDRVFQAKQKVWAIEKEIEDLGIDDKALRRDTAYEVLKEIREFAEYGDLTIYDDKKGEPIPVTGDSPDWPHPRFMGGVGQLSQAAKWLPLDWVTDSNEHERQLTVGWSENRGKYIHSYSPWLAVATGDVGEGPKPGSSRIIGSPSPERRATPAVPSGIEMGEGTMVHELVHRTEEVRDGITGAEWTFYVSRVSPGRNMRWPDAEKLSEVTGSGSYQIHEVTRVDDFTDAYSGKTYGDEMDSSWEILTMGIEDLVTGEHEIIEKDDEYRQFVLGSLALL